MTGLTQNLIVSKDVWFSEVGGEAVLLNTSTGKYFTLDEVGACMWKLISQHGQLEPVYQALLGEYDVAPQKLEEDLIALADLLVEKGLIQIVAPEA